jgi:hypothetical protein
MRAYFIIDSMTNFLVTILGLNKKHVILSFWFNHQFFVVFSWKMKLILYKWKLNKKKLSNKILTKCQSKDNFKSLYNQKQLRKKIFLFLSQKISMITNNSYTPIRKIKKTSYDTTNKDDYDVNLRTSLNVQRKNPVIPNIIQM